MMTFFRALLSPFTSLIGIILIVVGCPFFGIGAYEAWQARLEAQTFVAVTGTVVDNSYQTTVQDGVESGAYFPVVSFIPVDGAPVRFTDGVGSLPPDYEVGESVPVLYDPADPQKARLNSWKRVWFVPTLLMSIGGLPFLVFWGWAVGAAWKGKGLYV